VTVVASANGLRRRLARWADARFIRAHEVNLENIERLLEHGGQEATLLDLGCDDGALTVRFGAVVGTDKLQGVEIVESQARLATERGVEIRAADLNHALPYDDETIDVVCSNQVIEHLAEADNFVREIFRVLRPGGYAVVSTENLASWHNIASLLVGWEPFSLANVSDSGGGLGNPLAVHRGEPFEWKSWEHVRVYAFRGLAELFSSHGFAVEAVCGAGYFPLPARVGRWDRRHAAFLTVKARRPQHPPRSD
jgi:SAM-dependent methyltransferase